MIRSWHRGLPLFLVLVGLFLIVPSQLEINNAKEAATWRPESARITRSEIERLGSRHERLLVEGILLSNGKRFTTHRDSFGGISTPAQRKAVIGMFPAGEEARVYVSPSDPTDVVLLKSGSLTAMYALQLVGLTLIALSGWAVLTSRRQASIM